MYGKSGAHDTFEKSDMYMISYNISITVEGAAWTMRVDENNRYLSPNVGREIPPLTIDEVKFSYRSEKGGEFELDHSTLPTESSQKQKALREISGYRGVINSVIFYRNTIKEDALQSHLDWDLITASDIGYSLPNPIAKTEPQYYRFYDDINEYLMISDVEGVFGVFHFNGARLRHKAMFDLLPVFSLEYGDLDSNFFRSVAHNESLLAYDQGSTTFMILKFVETSYIEGSDPELSESDDLFEIKD